MKQKELSSNTVYYHPDCKYLTNKLITYLSCKYISIKNNFFLKAHSAETIFIFVIGGVSIL